MRHRHLLHHVYPMLSVRIISQRKDQALRGLSGLIRRGKARKWHQMDLETYDIE